MTIIWVVGKSCSEGKTWLQNYIEYKYQNRRVVSGISLQTKTGNITHALTKHPLSTADIFLFNIAKSVDTSTEINYKMLESIKAVIAFVCTIKYALVSGTKLHVCTCFTNFQQCQTFNL